MKTLLLAAAVLAMAATPALAQSYGPDVGVGNVAAPASGGAGPARRPVNYDPGYGGDNTAGGYGSYAMVTPGYGAAEPGYGAYAMAGPVVAGPVVAPDSRCWVSTSDTRGFGYFGRCGSSNNDTDAGLLGLAEPNTSILPPR